MSILATHVGTHTRASATMCPRCGIEHTDYQRARRWVLCIDCRTHGSDWAERARREIVSLAKATAGPRCRRGHELSDDNVYVRPDGTGRECLTCRLARRRRYDQERAS